MILLLAACFPDMTPPQGLEDNPWRDYDGDGYSAFDADCDDADATVFPGAPELLDGLDNDCDDEVDEGLELADTGLPEDADGDGWTADEDCNDDIASIHPGAEEVPGNSIDEDCDGRVCALPWDLAGELELGDVALELPVTGEVSLAVGDFDGDGLPDLAIGAQSEGRVYILLNAELASGALGQAHAISATGGFTQFGFAVAAADLDGEDGDELVVLARNGGEDARLFFFADPLAVGDSGSAGIMDAGGADTLGDGLLVADLDGDGDPELALTTVQGAGYAVRVMELDPALASGSHSVSGLRLSGDSTDRLKHLAAGDIDGDGVDELLVSGDRDLQDSFWVLSELPAADDNLNLVAARHAPGMGEALFSGGDADGDGHQDVVASWDMAAEQDGRAWLLSGEALARGEIEEIEALQGLGGGERFGLEATLADLDGDGLDDVVVGGRVQGRTYLFASSGHDALLRGGGSDGYRLLATDLDQDCVPDLVIGSHNTGSTWLMLSSTR